MAHLPTHPSAASASPATTAQAPSTPRIIAPIPLPAPKPSKPVQASASVSAIPMRRTSWRGERGICLRRGRAMKWLGLVVAAVLGGSAVAAPPLVGPWPVAEPTNVLVLGTPHLSGVDGLRPEWLEPLLGRLAAWKPQLITIEGLSGPECFLLRRYDKSWPQTADDYCARVESVGGLAAKSTGLDMPAAEAAAEQAVRALGPSSTPADHRHMAALFAAARAQGAGDGEGPRRWPRNPRLLPLPEPDRCRRSVRPRGHGQGLRHALRRPARPPLRRLVGGAEFAHGRQHPRRFGRAAGRPRARHRRKHAQALFRRLSRDDARSPAGPRRAGASLGCPEPDPRLSARGQRQGQALRTLSSTRLARMLQLPLPQSARTGRSRKGAEVIDPTYRRMARPFFLAIAAALAAPALLASPQTADAAEAAQRTTYILFDAGTQSSMMSGSMRDLNQ